MSEARRSHTYADLLALPPHQVGELVGGELQVSPRPAPRHAHATWRISGALSGRDGPGGAGVGGPGGWRFLGEPELHLAEDVLVPDIAAWRWARLPELADQPAIDVVPDWICEVLSPSTARWDRLRKMEVYRRSVEYAWFVDPALQTVEVYEQSSGRWLLFGTFGGDETPLLPPFDDAPLNLARWW